MKPTYKPTISCSNKCEDGFEFVAETNAHNSISRTIKYIERK